MIFTNTAATIVSGAVAERLNLPCYFVYGTLLSGNRRFLWILIDGNQTMCVCQQDLPTRLLVAGAGTTADGSKRWDFAISAAPDWSTCSPGPALLLRPSLSARGPAVSIRRGKEKKLNRLTASTSPAILYRFYNFFFFSCFHYVIFYFLYFAVCRTGGSASHFRLLGFQRGLAVVAEQTGRRDRHHLRNAQHFAGRQRRRPHCPLPQPLSAILGELLELFDDGQRICGRDGGYLRRMRRSGSVGRCRDRMHRRNRFRHRPFSARETGR